MPKKVASDPELLRQFVEDYRLEVEGVKFWTPYWRQELPTVDSPQPPTGPYKGKGTPQQLLHNLEGYLKTSTQRRPKDAEGYRQLMRQLNLGVDCSGFAYYIWDLWLAERGIELAEHLFKPRSDLLADFSNPVYTHPKHITRQLIQSWPEQVSLATIKEHWGNEPVRLAGVRYLTSDAATVVVDKAGDVEAGDIIGMSGSDGIPHCVTVLAREGQKISYAQSARTEPSKLGGVEYGDITIVDPRAPISDQYWESDMFSQLLLGTSVARRLKVLADG